MSQHSKAPIQLKKNFKVLDRDINAGYGQRIKQVLSQVLEINAADIRIEHDQIDTRYTKLLIPVRKDPAFDAILARIAAYDNEAGLPGKVTIINNRATLRIADSNLLEVIDRLAQGKL